MFDAEGAYDDLAVGTNHTVIISYDIADDNGTTTTKTTEIQVEIGHGGPVFTHKDGGIETTGRVSIMAIDAEDMLQNAHQFERVTPIDIEFDAQDAMGDAIAAVSADLTDEIARVEAAGTRQRLSLLN